jgi:hypothetical protein
MAKRKTLGQHELGILMTKPRQSCWPGLFCHVFYICGIHSSGSVDSLVRDIVRHLLHHVISFTEN